MGVIIRPTHLHHNFVYTFYIYGRIVYSTILFYHAVEGPLLQQGYIELIGEDNVQRNNVGPNPFKCCVWDPTLVSVYTFPTLQINSIVWR